MVRVIFFFFFFFLFFRFKGLYKKGGGSGPVGPPSGSALGLELSSSSLSCQTPLVQSIFEKYSPYDIFSIISSLVGSMKCSLRMALLRILWSMQTRNEPSDLYTRCKELTNQSVP